MDRPTIDPAAIRPGDCVGILGVPRRVIRIEPRGIVVPSFAPGGGEVVFSFATVSAHWVPAGETRP